MNTLSYGDYQGSVTFEDGHLVIELLHIDDAISTTCDSAAEAQRVFEELVDDYVATCKQIGKEPNKPFKGSFNVRIGSALHRTVVMEATKNGDTLNGWMSRAVEQRIERDHLTALLKHQTLRLAREMTETWSGSVRGVWRTTHHGGGYELVRAPRPVIEEEVLRKLQQGERPKSWSPIVQH